MTLQTHSFNKKQFLILGLLFHLVAAFFSYGVHHSDELFQVFEFAGYKLGLNQARDLPWEFHEKMRSGIEPLFVFCITHLCHLIHLNNPFLIALVLRLLVSLVSFYAVFCLLQFFEKEISDPKLKNRLWFLGSLFWCLPYFHARLSSENVSTTLFIFGFLLTLKNARISNSGIKLITAGLLMSVAFLCRFQISFMIAGLFAWLIFIEKIQFLKIFFIVFGSLLALLLGLFVDHWMYGEWTLSWWNYLDLNLFKHAAAQFGEQPVYYFFTESLAQLLPPFSVLFIFLFFVFWFRFKMHVLTWITVPFIFLHFFIGHKELRFLFPILNFLPLITVFALTTLSAKYTKFFQSKLLIRSFLVMNTSALFIFSLTPADNVSHILKVIYDLSDQKELVLVYEDQNPYNNSGSLNYFKNKAVISLKKDQLNDSLAAGKNLYYFSEKLNVSDTIRVQGISFKKVYSKFPAWLVHFNYNNWLERAGFSIYKK